MRNLLEGSAAGAIRGLPLTAENYGAAKDILKKRFGQPQIIINAHMEGLVKVAAVTVDNDLKRLRFLYDRVEAHVRALQALGIQCESYGKLLVPLLMEKLPPSMRQIISRAIDQPEWYLDILLKAFDSEIEGNVASLLEQTRLIFLLPRDHSQVKQIRVKRSRPAQH